MASTFALSCHILVKIRPSGPGKRGHCAPPSWPGRTYFQKQLQYRKLFAIFACRVRALTTTCRVKRLQARSLLRQQPTFPPSPNPRSRFSLAAGVLAGAFYIYDKYIAQTNVITKINEARRHIVNHVTERVQNQKEHMDKRFDNTKEHIDRRFDNTDTEIARINKQLTEIEGNGRNHL